MPKYGTLRPDKGSSGVDVMKWLIPIIILLLVALQYRLWVGEGSVANVVRLEQEITKQRAENERLRARNNLLAAEVEALKNGHDAIEDRARSEMGMIRDGETFFMIIDDKAADD